LLAARDDKLEEERLLEIWILVAPPSSASSVDELKAACLRGNVQKVASELFRRRPCLNSTAFGKTPLMLAAQGGHPEIVQLLLLAGAEAELELSNGASAIHFAVYSGNSNVTQLLLEAGATPDGGGHEHHPLMLACLLGYPEVARCLVNWGANLADCWKSAAPEAKEILVRCLRKSKMRWLVAVELQREIVEVTEQHQDVLQELDSSATTVNAADAMEACANCGHLLLADSV